MTTINRKTILGKETSEISLAYASSGIIKQITLIFRNGASIR